jgi:glyoxalase family protein
MKLEGVHHVTAITGDAPQNVEFYAGVLGLRLVKKTVNQDDPTIYHLFYADEKGSAGADITFFEYPGAGPGRAGDGMVHRVAFRVGSREALDFWEQRLTPQVRKIERSDDSLLFADPEGLDLEFVVDATDDEPLRAEFPGIPLEHAIRGFAGVRAYAGFPEHTAPLLEKVLNFESKGDGLWEARGSQRGGFYALDTPPEGKGLSGGGTVHHVAWASPMDDHTSWRERVAEAGARPTPVIDRFYFRSIYFREPSGVLFEIATLGPGFTADENLATLGQALSLPPDYEHLRDKLQDVLTPLPDPRRRAEAETA